ncbi:hypothetical protein J2Q11_13475 [Tenacibaculum finnmarkense genomovar finnmarkense]|uniref:hypothetical protein n=1 Tax=Tenacibaculum finnmarkense TaxID=2781243 RepID=UPI001E65955F|nr:hypothetical protein [Tenacibaculum finnmarkense]MCD8418711.1 hypothetical protein [Tenacibaculum finnmarkense genomovar finnmarkense]MCG8187035.1 hypothetical protein [Tenacibaculum finnmarkense genomovar finnmarkense]MCG8203563.1 hypothetical protein [Tenacibaculum finnmarkense genomovar finnmarkense]MCG8211067.1 hypothetical protein [Tenacibaculum finnmarkense genomovar finnmarkense]MCG8213825.1 hypothetical protein [Tenacibaculum finnmarkense genomovar finnmarkense]
MRKVIGLLGIVTVIVLFSFTSKELKVSDQEDCYDRFGWCDSVATGVGFSVDMSYEEEHDWFTDCMEYGGC